MRKLLDTVSTPPGGWVYREPTTGVEFRNLSYNAVLQQARAHREAVGLPVDGDWLDSVPEILITSNPNTPWVDTEKPVRHFTSDDVVRFMDTMARLAGSNLVDEAEHNRRIDICASCPKNGVIACKYCGWLGKKITEFIGGRNIPKKGKVHRRACLACGCDLTAKTAVPMDILKQVDEGKQPDYAPGCWMLEG